MKGARRGVPLRKLSYCDLPDWFDLKRYSPSGDFDLQDWLRELYMRTVFVHQTEIALELFGRYWETDVEETLADRLVASNSPKSTKDLSGKIDEATDPFFTPTVNPIDLYFLAWIMMEVSRKSTQLTKRIMKSVEALDAEDWSDELDAFLSKAVDELLKIPNHVSKRAIILLTDGGIDAMSLKPSNLFNSDVSHIAVYTVATTETAEVPLFHIPSNLDPVLSFLQIVNALQAHSSLAGRSTWVDVEKKQPIFIHHPRTDEVEFQFTFEKGRNVKIILEDPKRQEIAPYAQGDTYQLYRVNEPRLGFWQAIIQGEESSRASQVHQIVVERKSSEMTSRKSGGLDIPVTELNFKPLKKSHAINEPITLEIKASPKANPLNLHHLDVLVISPADGVRLYWV